LFAIDQLTYHVAVVRCLVVKRLIVDQHSTRRIYTYTIFGPDLRLKQVFKYLPPLFVYLSIYVSIFFIFLRILSTNI